LADGPDRPARDETCDGAKPSRYFSQSHARAGDRAHARPPEPARVVPELEGFRKLRPENLPGNRRDAAPCEVDLNADRSHDSNPISPGRDFRVSARTRQAIRAEGGRPDPQ